MGRSRLALSAARLDEAESSASRAEGGRRILSPGNGRDGVGETVNCADHFNVGVGDEAIAGGMVDVAASVCPLS